MDPSGVVAVAPKPHLLFLLDAPAEVIQARKKEVAPEETKRQRDGYRAMAEPLPFAHIIDNNRPLEQVVGEIEQIITEYPLDSRRGPTPPGGSQMMLPAAIDLAASAARRIPHST